MRLFHTLATSALREASCATALARTRYSAAILTASCTSFVPILVSSAFLASPSVALTYVESSTGLIPPTMDGGRTELEFGDMNHDGNVDLVSIGDHGNPGFGSDQSGLLVWLGNGTGQWSVRMSGDFGYGGVALGDVNDDGFLDVAYGMHHNYSGEDFGDQLIEVALGDGSATSWVPWDDGLATDGEDYGMFGTDLADIDNDGDLDVGSCSFGCCAGVHVYENHGDGTWSPVFGFVGGNADDDFVFGDVNADGFADFAAVHASGTVYLGNGSGQFQKVDGNLPGAGGVGRRGLSLGDIDEDGDLDIAFRTSTGSLEVWRWVSTGVWADASGTLPNTGIDATQLVDANGDGYLDVVAYGTRQLRVWLGDGGTTWTLDATVNFAASGEYSALRAGADVDHNGRPDFGIVVREGSFPNDRNRLRVFVESSQPAALAVRLISPRGGERFVGGSTRFIDWISSVPARADRRPQLERESETRARVAARVDLDVSLQGPEGPWIPIAVDLPDNGRFQWRVPVLPPTADARIRVTLHEGTETEQAISARSFTIAAPTSASVEIADSRPSLRVVPNPSRDRVTFLGVDVREGMGVLGGSAAYRGTNAHGGRNTGPIEIWDATGRLVRRLPVGSEEWDGRDGTGRLVPAGAYLARVSSRSLPIIRIR